MVALMAEPTPTRLRRWLVDVLLDAATDDPTDQFIDEMTELAEIILHPTGELMRWHRHTRMSCDCCGGMILAGLPLCALCRMDTRAEADDGGEHCSACQRLELAVEFGAMSARIAMRQAERRRRWLVALGVAEAVTLFVAALGWWL
jgi:hypothetical protein